MSLFTFSHRQAQPEPLTPANTQITSNSYAIEKGKYRDVLKIYIEADDPNGEMFRMATGWNELIMVITPRVGSNRNRNIITI